LRRPVAAAVGLAEGHGDEFGELIREQGTGELLEVVIAEALIEVPVSTLGHGLPPSPQPDRLADAVGNLSSSGPFNPESPT
jgi:hypothetical protein